MKSSARSSVTVSWTPPSRRRSSPRSSTNWDFLLPSAVWSGSSRNMAYKKKLHLCRPGTEPLKVETHRTKQKVRLEISDPPALERGVRQLLANKISGTMAGLWLLIPEYLRLGTWDLLKSWTGLSDEQVEPRLALQLINESALCLNGLRLKRSLNQRGFELANGLPFMATDPAIHQLLDRHSVAESQRLQIALGKVRQTFGHFQGNLIIIDPHRLKSFSKRQMVRRQKDKDSPPAKMAQTFFSLDAETKQPICFTTASSARTVTQATPELLTLTGSILKPNGHNPLVLADNEHYTRELFDWVASLSPFDLLVPMPYNQSVLRSIHQLPDEAYTSHWAGYATAKQPYFLAQSQPYYQFVQRKGEQNYDFKAFLCTSDRDEVEDLSVNYPQRWHIEVFFKNDQALGWHRAGHIELKHPLWTNDHGPLCSSGLLYVAATSRLPHRSMGCPSSGQRFLPRLRRRYPGPSGYHCSHLL